MSETKFTIIVSSEEDKKTSAGSAETSSSSKTTSDILTSNAGKTFPSTSVISLAAPVTEAVIFGKAVVGGTLNARLINVGTGEMTLPGETIWQIGGQTVSAENTALLLPDMSGKKIKVSIRDHESSKINETESITISDGFQGISGEEDKNSYISQFGMFNLHKQYGNDRNFISAGGAFSLINAKGNRIVGGNKSSGAKLPEYFEEFLKSNPTTSVFTTASDFALLAQGPVVNRLIIWGASVEPDKFIYPLSNIDNVYSNRYCFAFIYSTPTENGYKIGAAGNLSYGGKIPDDLHLKLAADDPVAIYATETAFAVLTRKGKVYAWGDTGNGGSISDMVKAELATQVITRIFTNSYAFCAVSETGQPFVWGNAAYGGTLPAALLEQILDDDGVNTVVSTQGAFCIITSRRKKAVCWGHASMGGTHNTASSGLGMQGNIVLCKAASWAFCIISQFGQAQAWGNASYGGSFTAPAAIGIQSVSEAEPASDLQSEIESLFSIKSKTLSPAEAVTNTYYSGEDEMQLLSTDASFCLLTLNSQGQVKSVINWGYASHLMGSNVKQILYASKLRQVVSNNGAYAALVNYGNLKGAVITWGDGNLHGGKMVAEQKGHLAQDVNALYALTSFTSFTSPTPVLAAASGFAAMTREGVYCLWGNGPGNAVVE